MADGPVTTGRAVRLAGVMEDNQTCEQDAQVVHKGQASFFHVVSSHGDSMKLLPPGEGGHWSETDGRGYETDSARFVVPAGCIESWGC